MPVIIVEALQGTGKTWLCNKVSKLSNVICLDIDPITIEAYEKKKAGVLKGTTEEIATEHIENVINNQPDKIVVVVAGGFDLPSKYHPVKYFMSIPTTEFACIYRRFMARELRKLTSHQKKLMNIIKRGDVHDIYNNMNMVVQFIVGFMGYNEYETLYRRMKEQAKKKGSIFATQRKIYEDIVKMSKALRQ